MTNNKRLTRKQKRRLLLRIRQIAFLCACLALIIVLGSSLIRLLFHGNSSDPRKEVLKHSRNYPKSLVTLMKENPETAQFVADYKKYGQKHFKISLKQDVVDGTIPYFMQWDKRWGYETYNGDYLALTGSAPTCLSMIVVGLTGNLEANPFVISQYIESHNYIGKEQTLKSDLWTDGVTYFDIVGTELAISKTTITTSLEQKQPIIALMRKGDFTTKEHFIVLYDVNKKGDFKVFDPNSSQNSEKRWSFKTLEPQIKKLWSFSNQKY